jgi:asparagine synthase (glutamine-hydrolysing)
MCGIAGIHVAPIAGRDQARAQPAVERMVDALGHRGPDGRGVTAVAGSGAADGRPVVVFGHTRLAIIDLSDRAAQPMCTADQRLSISFNGEIYNYRELRSDLERDGTRFHTGSDTEVILRCYERWGEACLERFDGMFAFALWDERDGVLRLVRDRLGIKPLYVFTDGAQTLFASEIRALLASGLVPRRLDHEGLTEYLAYQTTATPRTLVANVEMLPAGSIMTIDRHAVRRTRTYWDLLAMPAGADEDARAVPRETRRLLERAIARHLVSDVPVGVFLSGGMDSGALAALVTHVGVRPRTFTVSAPGSAFDEGPTARAVAEQLGTDHTDIVLTPDDVRAAVVASLGAFDHPSGDAVNTYIVSRAVRAAGITVALSGLGGDELFAGYPSFGRLARFARRASLLRSVPRVARAGVGRAVDAFGRSSIAASKLSELVASDGSLTEAYLIQRRVFSSTSRRRLLADPTVHRARAEAPYEGDLRRAEDHLKPRGVTAFVSYAESRTYMHDVLLRDTDQMSMRHGLEVRVPLLDHHLVSYIMGLPESARHPAPGAKPVLVAALGADLPRASAGPKRGFVLPFTEWMRGDLREVCEHHLGPGGLAGRDGFESQAVRALWQDFLVDSPRTSWSRPWTLVALNAWLETTGVTL